MTQKEARKRMDDLYSLALERFLHKTDFSVFEWLTDKEAEKYEKLQVKLGEK